MNTKQPRATIQCDVDGYWVLLQSLGHVPADEHDVVFETGLPRMLDLLERHGLQGTFFVNAIDLENPSKRKLLERALDRGHELANHGFDHTYFSRMSSQEKAEQIGKSSDMLRAFSGQAPLGFRAAGYDMDAEAISLLRERGYAYDSSVFPSSMTSLLRWSHRLITGQASSVYGNRRCAGSWDGTLTEVPVTVFPGLRLPLHFSYGALLGGSYLRAGLARALQLERPVNFLFHVADLADPVRDRRLRWVPSFALSVSRRLALADAVVRFLAERAEVLTTSALCGATAAASLESWNHAPAA